MTSNIKIQKESYMDVIEEALPLVIEHWSEVHPGEEAELSLDHTSYASMDLAGQLVLYTARVNDELVGYVLGFKIKSLQYRNKILVMAEALYVKPSYRGSFYGIKLIKKLIGEGDIVEIRSPLITDFSPLLKRLGFTETERVYSCHKQRS